jgi:hypothetical protein
MCPALSYVGRRMQTHGRAGKGVLQPLRACRCACSQQAVANYVSLHQHGANKFTHTGHCVPWCPRSPFNMSPPNIT